MTSLNDTTFFKELSQRKTTNSIIYEGKLLEIANDVTGFLEYIKATFQDYPEHGIQHSYRILDYVARVIGNQIKQLTDTEIFCFILSALFHDTGMSLVGFSNKNDMRSSHPQNASIVIDKYFEEALPKFKSKDRIKSIIKYICLAHGQDIDKMYNDSSFFSIDTINGDNVRNSILSVFLRIGDLLDLDEERTNWLAMEFFPTIFQDEAKAHNLRHLRVQKYHYDSETLNVEVTVQNIVEYKIWKQWLGYLEKEILYANTKLKKENIFFPELTKAIKKDDYADFDVEEIRFELDDKGGIWEIISKSIYTDKFDFIREVIQNSIDATLSVTYLDESISLDHASPRSWTTSQNTTPVYICYSAKKQILYIIDSGIGMNKTDLQQFLFKVSGTGKRDHDKRNFNFPSIAKYGIGFVSCLINAEKIEIFTKKAKEKHLHKVTLETGINEAFIEKKHTSDYVGTTLSMKLKEKFSFESIYNYICSTFKYPSVELRCIDIDNFIINNKKLKINNTYESYINEPYKLLHDAEVVNKKRWLVVEPITTKIKKLTEIETDTENIINWIINNQYYDEIISDNKKFQEFKHQIKETLTKISDSKIQLQYPFSISTINQKDLFNQSYEYINKLQEFAKFIANLVSEQSKLLKEYPSFYNKITTDAVTFNNDWEYTVIDLNDDLRIQSITQYHKPIDLSTRTGILIMKHSYQDYDVGIEYSSINGFIFHNGIITSQLIQLQGYHEVIDNNKRLKKIILGSYDSYGSLRDMLAAEYFDMDDYDKEAYFLETSDGEYVTGMRFEPTYNIIKINDNKFTYYKDEVLDINTSFFKGSNPQELFYLAQPIESNEISYELEDIRKTDLITSSYCQDGISIPFEIEQLFPIGYFKIICNTTHSSRIPLNVTRHEISRISSDIESWYDNTGKTIQNQIYINTLRLLKNLNLDFNFSEIMETYWSEHQENTFGINSKLNLIKINREMNNSD